MHCVSWFGKFWYIHGVLLLCILYPHIAKLGGCILESPSEAVCLFEILFLDYSSQPAEILLTTNYSDLNTPKLCLDYSIQLAEQISRRKLCTNDHKIMLMWSYNEFLQNDMWSFSSGLSAWCMVPFWLFAGVFLPTHWNHLVWLLEILRQSSNDIIWINLISLSKCMNMYCLLKYDHLFWLLHSVTLNFIAVYKCLFH